MSEVATTDDLLWDFLEEQGEVITEDVGSAYKTRDGIGVFLPVALSCTEVHYSDNSWNNYEPEVRCDSVVIAYTDGLCSHVVIAPYGKDNHCHVLNEEELDDYICLLQAYRKYMGKL